MHAKVCKEISVLGQLRKLFKDKDSEDLANIFWKNKSEWEKILSKTI